jgi:hypothetical protein
MTPRSLIPQLSHYTDWATSTVQRCCRALFCKRSQLCLRKSVQVPLDSITSLKCRRSRCEYYQSMWLSEAICGCRFNKRFRVQTKSVSGDGQSLLGSVFNRAGHKNLSGRIQACGGFYSRYCAHFPFMYLRTFVYNKASEVYENIVWEQNGSKACYNSSLILVCLKYFMRMLTNFRLYSVVAYVLTKVNIRVWNTRHFVWRLWRRFKIECYVLLWYDTLSSDKSTPAFRGTYRNLEGGISV